MRANGTMFSPMDSKKRPSVPQRKQILAGGAYSAVKHEPDAAEVNFFGGYAAVCSVNMFNVGNRERLTACV